MDISAFPRLALAHLPTALEPMPNLSRHLCGPNILIKRDDCTGLAGGGNKTRKLEFLMADALEQGADTIVTVGATQSNHVRQTIAAAVKLGLRAEAILWREVSRDQDYETNGNVLLDNLMGATMHHRPPGEDLNAEGEQLTQELNASGSKAYFVPTGGSNPIGALGYLDCAQEILGQSQEMGETINAIIVATGSQGTQGGLLVGFAANGSDISVHGITVSRPGPEQEELVFSFTEKTAEFVGLDREIKREQVICDGNYYGPAYGEPNDAMIEAVILCARLEGILLDPVYSGKAMAGLIGKIRAGEFSSSDTVVFLHTGGQAALHAYKSTFDGN